MKVAGRCDDGTSVMMNVHGFCPSFFVRIDDRPTREGILIYQDYIDLITCLRSLVPFSDNVSSELNELDILILDEAEAIQEWKCGDGFQNGLSHPLFKLSFSSLAMYQFILKTIKYPRKIAEYYHNLQLYDCETDVQVKSLAITKIRATGWVQIHGAPTSSPYVNDRVTREIDVQLQNCHLNNLPIVEPVHIDKISVALKVMTFDFEVYSSVKGTFPDTTRPADCIFQASLIFKATGANSKAKKYLLHLYEIDKLDDSENDDTIYVFCRSEVYLIYQFTDLIRKEDPDIITGHNINGFDWKCLFDRFDVHDIVSHARDFSRIPGIRCEAPINEFKSGQVSAMERRILHCPGRLNVDFQIWIERNKPANLYANYKLETIAQKELQEGKDNVTAEFMFDAYERQCPKDLALVAKYCVVDSCLVDKLITKLNVVISLFAMAYSVNVILLQSELISF